MDQSRLGEDLATRDRGSEAGHLEGRDEDEALSHRHVGGVAGEPFFVFRALFPGVVGHEHAAGLAGEFDAGAAVEVETPRLFGEAFGFGQPARFIEVEVTTLRDGLAEEYIVVMAEAIVTDEAVIEFLEKAVAVDNRRVGGDRSATQGGDGGEDFVGRAWWVKAAEGAVELAALGLNRGVGGVADAGREIGEVVVGLADEGEHFAGGDIDGDGGADLIADGLLGRELEVDVEGADQVFSLEGQSFLERWVDLVAGGIDAKNCAAGLTLELAVEGFFQAVFTDGALHFEGGEIFAGEVLDVEFFVYPDKAEGVGGAGAEGVEPSTGGTNLQRRAHGEALDQAGIFRSGEIVDELVRQEQLVAEVAREGGGVHFFGTADDFVHLVEVALHDADAAHAGKRHFA